MSVSFFKNLTHFSYYWFSSLLMMSRWKTSIRYWHRFHWLYSTPICVTLGQSWKSIIRRKSQRFYMEEKKKRKCTVTNTEDSKTLHNKSTIVCLLFCILGVPLFFSSRHHTPFESLLLVLKYDWEQGATNHNSNILIFLKWFCNCKLSCLIILHSKYVQPKYIIGI